MCFVFYRKRLSLFSSLLILLPRMRIPLACLLLTPFVVFVIYLLSCRHCLPILLIRFAKRHCFEDHQVGKCILILWNSASTYFFCSSEESLFTQSERMRFWRRLVCGKCWQVIFIGITPVESNRILFFRNRIMRLAPSLLSLIPHHPASFPWRKILSRNVSRSSNNQIVVYDLERTFVQLLGVQSQWLLNESFLFVSFF